MIIHYPWIFSYRILSTGPKGLIKEVLRYVNCFSIKFKQTFIQNFHFCDDFFKGF